MKEDLNYTCLFKHHLDFPLLRLASESRNRKINVLDQCVFFFIVLVRHLSARIDTSQDDWN